MRNNQDLINRLKGIYAIPVNDGGGPLNGSSSFTRTFQTATIQHEAAAEIEALNEALSDAEMMLNRPMDAYLPGDTECILRGNQNAVQISYQMHRCDWNEDIARKLCADMAKGINPNLQLLEECIGNSVMLTFWEVGSDASK